MNRRSLLKTASGAIATASASIVAIPGVGYLIDTVWRGSPADRATERVVRLKDLPVGRPVQVAITGRRRDAWTSYEKEAIGRVWLLRKPSERGEEAEHKVIALSSTCPHLGCAVKLSGSNFVCPCHHAAFDQTGRKLTDEQFGRKNPSPRDLDSFDCQITTDDSGERWVEVTYQRYQLGLTEKVPEA